MVLRIAVPASTSNIGPAFDAIGLALDIYNEFFVEPAEEVSVSIEGEGEGMLPVDENNLFIKSFRSTCKYIGSNMNVKVKQKNVVPIGRGLGSSATAIVGGIVAAQELTGRKLSMPEVIDIARKFEPHPDNVLPSYIGGLVIAATNGDLTYIKMDFPKDLKVVVVVPELLISTAESRSVLPNTYQMNDVVFNVQRVALLIAALQARRFDLLKEAVKDKIHQPYRCGLIPSFWDVLSEGYRAGAYAVYLSGAGSCIGALADKDFDAIGKAMCGVLESAGIDARFMVLDVNDTGAAISYVEHM